MTDQENERREILLENSEKYYIAVFDIMAEAMEQQYLSHDATVQVLLAVAGAIAADLDEAGIEMFERQAANKVEYMRESKAAFDAATRPGRLQ